MNGIPQPPREINLLPGAIGVQQLPANEMFMPNPAAYSVDYGPESETHLRDYWRSIRNHLGLILGITAIITTLVAFYMARKLDVYEARVRIQVDADSNPALGAFKGSQVIVNNTYDDPTYINTQIQILSSASLLSRVIKALDLEHNQSFLNPQVNQRRSVWQSLLHMVGLGYNNQQQLQAPEPFTLTTSIGPTTASNTLEQVNQLAPYVESLQALLEVQPVKDTRLIEIHFTHPDPQVAAKVANTIAEMFMLTNLEKKTETNATTSDFLQKHIAELQSEIRTGEEKLINYAKSNQILSLDASQNTVVDRLTGLNKQLLEAENERKTAEASYRGALAPGAALALAERETGQVAGMDEKLAALRMKRAELLIENTREWPEVKQVEEQIAVLERQAQDTRTHATSNLLTNLETRYRQALERERALRDAFDKQRAETLTQNEAAVNYRIIQQEIETNKELLSGLLQRGKENDVSAAGTQNNIHIVDYAPTPKLPVGPRRLQVIAVALLLSLSFGVGLALFLEYLDDTIDTPDDVEKTLHLPPLAVIPLVEGQLRRFLPGSRAQRSKLNGNGNGLALLTQTDAPATLAESYRQLRTSVLLSKAGRAPKTLLVTSSLPGEGKTTTAINTAYSLAQTGAKVLIIDADMRRPRLHSVFHLSNKNGLSTILSNEMTAAEMLILIQHDVKSGLYLLTCGPVPPNPAELLGSEQMRRFLAAVESTFTHIIIDSPPVASFTDGVLLGSMVDGVLLVVHGGKSSKEIAQRGRQVLLDVGAKIIGVVLNMATLRSHDYYYYQSNYAQYYAKETSAADVGNGLSIKATD